MDKLFTQAKIEIVENEKLFVASDDVVDRQGDVIIQDGWDLTNFKNNPVIQWAHNPYEPAIGTASVGFKTIGGKKKLVFQPTFHKKSDMSRLISDLVEEGIIKASSVGFKPIEVEDNKFLKNELLEISFVNVPANQNALALSGAQLAMTKGYNPELIKQVTGIDIKEDKKAIPYKKYPHAPEDMEWDGSSEVKAASVEDLKVMCAWYDSEDAENKSAYKMPHHTVDGYKTVLAGCQAAMGAMMGARGGVDIPEADSKAVYAHLAKHYAEFDKEPPMMREADEIIDRYVDVIDAKDMVIDLRKTVNTFIEEFRVNNEKLEAEKVEIAKESTDKFLSNIDKRFKSIELNVQGLQEGISPTDQGLEQRLMDIESNIEQIANGIRAMSSQSSSEKGDAGREPNRAPESKSDQQRRLALKVMNKALEVMNKTSK